MLASVIIPVLNEEERIARTVEAARGEYSLDEVEIIMVDGGSADATCDVITGDVVLVRGRRGRSVQLNAGVEAAKGDIFVFCHADTLLPLGWLGAVQDALSDPAVSGGAFQCTTLPETFFLMKFFNRINAPTLWQFMTGEMGQFMSRETFFQVGGFPEIPLMEDIEMSRRLKDAGRLVRPTLRVVTSSRRFEENGWVHQYLLNLYNLTRYLYFGATPEQIAASYRSSREEVFE
jgi:rSAM/selenodomain-associated transferase 2